MLGLPETSWPMASPAVPLVSVTVALAAVVVAFGTMATPLVISNPLTMSTSDFATPELFNSNAPVPRNGPVP